MPLKNDQLRWRNNLKVAVEANGKVATFYSGKCWNENKNPPRAVASFFFLTFPHFFYVQIWIRWAGLLSGHLTTCIHPPSTTSIVRASWLRMKATFCRKEKRTWGPVKSSQATRDASEVAWIRCTQGPSEPTTRSTLAGEPSITFLPVLPLVLHHHLQQETSHSLRKLVLGEMRPFFKMYIYIFFNLFSTEWMVTSISLYFFF